MKEQFFQDRHFHHEEEDSLTRRAQNRYAKGDMSDGPGELNLNNNPDSGATPPDASANQPAPPDAQQNQGPQDRDQAAQQFAQQKEALEVRVLANQLESMERQSQEEHEQTEKNMKLLTDRAYRAQYLDQIFEGVDMSRTEFFDQVFSSFYAPYASMYDRFMQLMNGAVKDAQKDKSALRHALEESLGREPTQKEVMDAARDLDEDIRRFQVERNVRKSLHDLNAAIYLPSFKADQLFDFLQSFGTDMADYAARTSGVQEMMGALELAMQTTMAENGGYLPPEAVLGRVQTEVIAKGTQDERGREAVGQTQEGDKVVIAKTEIGRVEQLAKQYFQAMVSRGEVGIRDPKDPSKVAELHDVDEAQLQRIYSMARGLHIASLRLFSIAAESNMPAGGGLYSSLAWQDILQSMVPMTHLIAKYGVTESNLAAYLFSIEGKRFSPKELREIYRAYQKDPNVVTNRMPGANKPIVDKLYLMVQNPNKAGSIWDYLSWRVGETPGVVSMTQEFLKRGEKAMVKRVADRMGLAFNESIDYGQKASLPVEISDMPEITDEEKRQKTEATNRYYASVYGVRANEVTFNRVVATNLVLNGRPISSLTDADKQEISRVLQNSHVDFDEYAKWIGLGLRFEKLRGALEGLGSHDHAKAHAAEEAEPKAMAILQEMIEHTPHRLLLTSKYIQARLKKEGKMPKDLDRMIRGATLLEEEILKRREDILNAGGDFNSLSVYKILTGKVSGGPELQAIAEEVFKKLSPNVSPQAVDTPERQDIHAFSIEEIQQLRHFAETMQEDFRVHNDAYKEEFIRDRNLYHGFNLFVGDAPMSEFNMQALGPTGGFARRARDNKTQSEAGVEELKMLSSLPHITYPQEALAALKPIYDKIAMYDAGKAKDAIAQKLDGIAQYFMQDKVTDVPIVGLFYRFFKRTSYAQLMNTAAAGSWSADDLNFLFHHAFQESLITEAHMHALEEKYGATKMHSWYTTGLLMGQLGMGALLMFLFGQLVKPPKG